MPKRWLITVQPAPQTDFITPDGVELTKKPYPFSAFGDDPHGEIVPPGSRLNIIRIVGFADKLDRAQVDLWWRDLSRDPQAAVGRYLVTQDDKGGMATHLTAIETVNVREVEDA